MYLRLENLDHGGILRGKRKLCAVFDMIWVLGPEKYAISGLLFERRWNKPTQKQKCVLNVF